MHAQIPVKRYVYLADCFRRLCQLAAAIQPELQDWQAWLDERRKRFGIVPDECRTEALIIEVAEGKMPPHEALGHLVLDIEEAEKEQGQPACERAGAAPVRDAA